MEKRYHFYICGPTPMMECLVHALEEWGVPDARIHFGIRAGLDNAHVLRLASLVSAEESPLLK